MKDAFTKVVGNRALCRSLADDVLERKLPHAFILEGPTGSGKHTIAKMTAAALLCTEHNDLAAPIPCLQCDACRKVLEDKCPDLIFVHREEDRQSIGVDTVRFMRDDVRFLPNGDGAKIYVIEEADKMTTEAQNAFLLTLEEPPPYVFFILLCESASSLLETIKSRAPILRTQPLSIEEIDRYLCENDRRAAQMKLADPSTYRELLVSSHAGIGPALDYLDQRKFEPVKRLRASTVELISAAVNRKSSRPIVSLLMSMPAKRDALLEHLQMLSLAVRDLLLLKKSDQAPLLFFVDRDEAIDLCDRTTMTALYRLYEAIQTATSEIKMNANVRLTLTKMALSAELI